MTDNTEENTSGENLWPIFHTYYRYVRWGKLDKIKCPNDGYGLYLRADKDFEPALMCPMCNTMFSPGINTINEIKQAVEDIKNGYTK